MFQDWISDGLVDNSRNEDDLGAEHIPFLGE